MTDKLHYFRDRRAGTIFSTIFPELYADDPGRPTSYEAMTAVAGRAAVADHARADLRAMLAPVGERRKSVFTILRRVSKSGMSRDISLHVVEGDTIRDITWRVAQATGRTTTSNGPVAIREPGCGMDMGFHLVSSLGSCLWPEGTPAPHGTRNGEPDTAGGYAITQTWL